MTTATPSAKHQPTPWPTRPDGTPKTMGEMTREEQRAQWRDAVHRVAAKNGWPVEDGAA